MVVLIGLAVAAVVAVAAGIILYLQTSNGVVQIEIDDPSIKVFFDKETANIEVGDKEPIKLSPGKHKLFVQRGDLAFETDYFEIKNGGNITLKVKLLPGRLQIVNDEGTPLALRPLPGNYGTLKLTIADAGAVASVITPAGDIKGLAEPDQELQLAPGEYRLKVKRGDLDEFETDKFIIARNKKVALRVELTQDKVQVVQGERVIGERSLVAAGNFALRFKGDGYIHISSLAYDGGPVTVEARIKVETKNLAAVVVGGGKEMAALFIEPNIGFGFHVVTAGANDETYSGRPKELLNGEAHIAGVWDGKQVFCYLNGVKLREGSHPANPEQINGFYIGGFPSKLGFVGTIDEVRISKVTRYKDNFTPETRFKSDKDTLALYHCDEGRGEVLKDSSGNGHDGKIVGAEWEKVGMSPTAPGINSEWVELFNGKDLTGWKQIGHAGWTVNNGVLVGDAGPPGWLMTEREYADFELEFEYLLYPGSNSGIFLRAWPEGAVTGDEFHEIQLVDDNAPKYAAISDVSRTGSLYGKLAAKLVLKPAPGKWHRMTVAVFGEQVRVHLNQQQVLDGKLTTGKRTQGSIGLQLYPTHVEFRNLRLRELKADGTPKFSAAGKFTNSLGMEFMRVPKGKSWLGGTSGKIGEPVEISNDFYMGVYEVTQGEWQEIMGTNPSVFSRSGSSKDAVKGISDAELKWFPVENVSWDDCQVFLKRLNEQTKENGWVYRLPTEREWEYSCRGGPMADVFGSAFDFYLEKPTNQLQKEKLNFDQGLNRTCKVGSYPPNALGLHDMHGNVGEWCADDLGGKQRASSGGGWFTRADLCTANTRWTKVKEFCSQNIGLRLVRVPSGKTGAAWVPLFNGMNLNGWHTYGDSAGAWKVVDGAITSEKSGYLCTDRGDYGDFHLKLEAQASDGSNGGIFFRAGQPLKPEGDYEVQVNSTHGDLRKTGSLLRVVDLKETLVPPNQWCTLEIIARGKQIQVLVNGKITADHNETRPNQKEAGYIVLQNFAAGRPVFYRNIEIKEGK